MQNKTSAKLLRTNFKMCVDYTLQWNHLLYISIWETLNYINGVWEMKSVFDAKQLLILNS